MAVIFEPNTDHYQFLHTIGRGKFSKSRVSLARHVPSKSQLAVRVINLDSSEMPLSLIQHEMEMHRLLRHKNILPIYLSFTNKHDVWMLHPCAVYGSCLDMLQLHFRAGLPELATAYIIRDVLQALSYLHSRSIIHRSIRGSHILVDSTGKAYLSGLRHCCSLVCNGKRLKSSHEFPDFYSTNLNWASRELLEQNLSGYDTKSDIYSLGITVCELTNGIVPFLDMPLTQMLLSKIGGKVPLLFDINTIPELRDLHLTEIDQQNDISALYARDLSQNLHEFVSKCLEYAPESRPTADDLMTHSFIKQLSHKSSKLPTLPQLLQPLNKVTEPTQAQDLRAEEEEEISKRLNEMPINVDWIF